MKPLHWRTAKILEAISQGYDTAPKLEPIVGWPTRHISARLGQFARAGLLRRVGTEVSKTSRPHVRWALVEHVAPPPRTPSRVSVVHRSLTAALLGDPTVGRSMLDRRQAAT